MPVNPADFLGLQILQACQVTRYDIGFTIMDSNKYDLVTEILGPSWAITDEDLWKSLEAAKKRAKASEEYVVQFEKTRLIEEGLQLRLRVEAAGPAKGRTRVPVFKGRGGLVAGVDPLITDVTGKPV